MKEKDNLTKNSIIIFVLTTMGSAINYLCQICMGRFFSISNYGVINTIFSLTLIVSVIGNTSSMIVSKLISENIKKNSNIVYNILNIVHKTCIYSLIILLMMTPLINYILKWNYIIIILAVITLITSIYPIVYQGIFGGLNKFIKLGLYTLINPIFKVISLIIIILMNFDGYLEIYITLIFIIIGNIISLIIGEAIVKNNLHNKIKKIDLNKILNEYGDIFITNILIMILINIDILYLSIYSSSTVIGLYSSVLIFGKMIYYFVTALVTVMLPLVSKNKNNNAYVKKMLYKTIIYTFLLTLIFLVPINIFGNEFLNIFFGSKYINAIEYMKYASMISVSYSLNLIVLNYIVGINKLKFMKKSLIISTISLTVLLNIFNKFMKSCFIIITITNFLIFIVNIVYIKNDDKI